MARQLVIELVGNSKKLTQALDEAEKKTSTFGDKVQNAGKKMTMFTTVPIVAFLGAATKAGVEEAAQMDNLAKVLENVTGATQKQVGAVEEQIGAWQKASMFSDGELRPAFEDLVIATKDVESANRLMANALDIATATGKPLTTVTEAMAKAHLGNVGALGRLGIATKNTAGETMSFEEIMKSANQTYGGAAQAASETTAGKMDQLKKRFADLTEEIGMTLIPIIEKVVGWFSGLSDWLNRTGIGADKLVIALVAVAALGPVITVVSNLTTAVKALNVAMAANPAIVLAAALTAVYVASEKLTGGFDGIKGHALSLSQTIKNLKRDVENLIDTFEELTSLGMSGDSWFTGSPLKKLPGIGKLFKAAGGPVTGGSPYVVGERGPELFVPGRSGSIVPNHAMGGGGTVVYLSVSSLDPAGAATAVVRAIEEYESRNGAKFARAGA